MAQLLGAALDVLLQLLLAVEDVLQLLLVLPFQLFFIEQFTTQLVQLALDVLRFADVLLKALLDGIGLLALLLGQLFQRGRFPHSGLAARALAAGNAIVVPHLEVVFDLVASGDGDRIHVPQVEEFLPRVGGCDVEFDRSLAILHGRAVAALKETVVEEQALEAMVVADLAAEVDALGGSAVHLLFHRDQRIEIGHDFHTVLQRLLAGGRVALRRHGVSVALHEAAVGIEAVRACGLHHIGGVVESEFEALRTARVYVPRYARSGGHGGVTGVHQGFVLHAEVGGVMEGEPEVEQQRIGGGIEDIVPRVEAIGGEVEIDGLLHIAEAVREGVALFPHHGDRVAVHFHLHSLWDHIAFQREFKFIVLGFRHREVGVLEDETERRFGNELGARSHQTISAIAETGGPEKQDRQHGQGR